MRTSLALVLLTAAIVAGCSTETTSPPPVAVTPPPPPPPAVNSPDELQQLRDENAQLRQQLYGAQKQVAVSEQKAAVSEKHAAEAEVKTENIELGKLAVGMSVLEANKAINGGSHLSKNRVQIVSQDDKEWVYRIWTGDHPDSNPGSGGAAPLGVNMRADHSAPPQAWVCTFDAHTGKLTKFEQQVIH